MMVVLNDETFVEVVLRKMVEVKESVPTETDSYILSFDFILSSKNGCYYTNHLDEIDDSEMQKLIYDELSSTYDFDGLAKEVEDTITNINAIQSKYNSNGAYYYHRDRFYDYWKLIMPQDREYINCLDFILYSHGLPSYMGEENEEGKSGDTDITTSLFPWP